MVAAEPFGANLHVRFAAGRTDRPRLEAALRQAGAEPSRMENVEPSLEDVFLAVVGTSANKEAA